MVKLKAYPNIFQNFIAFLKGEQSLTVMSIQSVWVGDRIKRTDRQTEKALICIWNTKEDWVEHYQMHTRNG